LKPFEKFSFLVVPLGEEGVKVYCKNFSLTPLASIPTTKYTTLKNAALILSSSCNEEY
jgi:hypothetical protein